MTPEKGSYPGHPGLGFPIAILFSTFRPASLSMRASSPTHLRAKVFTDVLNLHTTLLSFLNSRLSLKET